MRRNRPEVRAGARDRHDLRLHDHAKYAQIARESIPGVHVRPFGNGRGEADDHLHIDLGYVVTVPHGIIGARGVLT